MTKARWCCSRNPSSTVPLSARLRIQTNRRRKLALEQSVDLPRWLRDKSLAEVPDWASRRPDRRLVKTMLFKALFRIL